MQLIKAVSLISFALAAAVYAAPSRPAIPLTPESASYFAVAGGDTLVVSTCGTLTYWLASTNSMLVFSSTPSTARLSPIEIGTRNWPSLIKMR